MNIWRGWYLCPEDVFWCSNETHGMPLLLRSGPLSQGTALIVPSFYSHRQFDA